MNTQNKIRNIATKIIAMLMSAIYLTVSVNLPVLARDVSGPITDDNYDYEGDVEVTAGQVPNYMAGYMAGVSATDNNTKVSVGNNLSVTSNTGSTVTGVYVTGADAKVSVGKDLSVVSESTNTRGIDAQPNANTAAVTIGNNLTVDSGNTKYSAYGIEARPAAGATANITVGNSDTNQGNVTVSGTNEVRGISIAVNNTGSSSQGNTNITVGGDVKSSISESNDSASGVYLNTIAGAETNVDIGGAVKANGNTKAMGLDIHPAGNNTNEIYVGKGIFASAAEATGVNVFAQNTSNTTINIGKDSSGNAITVHSNGDNNKAANSSGISAQLQTGEGFTGSTTATINVEGNIVVSSEAAGARGIYADGGDSTNLNIQVKGDVTSNGAGIYTKEMSHAKSSTDIIIDGTVKSTADGIPAVILETTTNVGNENVNITAWKIESNEGTALFGIVEKDENNPVAPILSDEGSQEAVASHISYIIRVTQPEINNTPANVLSLANANGAAWDKKIDAYDVAGETEKVYVKLDVPEGYQLAGVYADADRTVALTQDENGSYYLEVPRGGGIDVNVALTLIQVDPEPQPQPGPNPSPQPNPNPGPEPQPNPVNPDIPPAPVPVPDEPATTASSDDVGPATIMDNSDIIATLNIANENEVRNAIAAINATPAGGTAMIGITGDKLDAGIIAMILSRRDINTHIACFVNGRLVLIVIPIGADLTGIIGTDGSIEIARLADAFGITGI